MGKKIKCAFCKKKVNLINVKCKCCEKIFCLEHKYPDSHNCEFENKLIKENKEKLIKENPKIKNKIIDKI